MSKEQTYYQYLLEYYVRKDIHQVSDLTHKEQKELTYAYIKQLRREEYAELMDVAWERADPSVKKAFVNLLKYPLGSILAPYEILV